MLTQDSFRSSRRLGASMLALLAASFVATPRSALAEGPTSAEYGVVLDLSGKQRMLTQNG